jgi:ligand-binding sensor domain-containing protein
MIADHQGHIWFVTSKGLFRQEKSSTYVEKFVLKYDHDLRIIFEDSSNNLWVTSENNGVYKIIPYRKFKSIQSNALKSPNAITLDTEGDLLIVSADTQLFKWRVATQTLETLSAPIFSAKNQVLARPIILQDGKETLWVAQGDGLAKVNLRTKQVSYITYPTSTPNYQQFRELRALNKDRNGNLWIGTYKNGIYRYNPITDTFTHLYRDAGLSHPEVWDIFKDNQDNIWVGTGDGLNLWQEANQQFFSFKNDTNKTDGLLGRAIQDIYQSRDGKLWIATQKGLNLYLPATKSFKHFDKKDGLPTSLIRAIQDDNSGHLWLILIPNWPLYS